MGYSDQHISKGSPDRGLLGHVVLPVVVSIVVGTSWYLRAANDYEGSLLPFEVLAILTLGLAVTFGVSMSIVRGFVMSVVLAAAVGVGSGLGVPSEFVQGDINVFFAIVETIFVLAFWLIGVTIVTMWHGRREARRQRARVDVAVEMAATDAPPGSGHDGTVLRLTATNIGHDPVTIEAMALRLGTGESVTFMEEMPDSTVPMLLEPGQSTSMWMAQESLERTLRLQHTHPVRAEVYEDGARRWDTHDLGRFARLGL